VKNGKMYLSVKFQRALLVIVLVFLSGEVSAKTVFDPFVQEFQVGQHSDPRKIDLVWGFPSGLLTPASIDKSWTNSGLKILSMPPSRQSPHLCLKLLAAMGDGKAGNSWTRWHRLRIQQLVSWPDSLATGGTYLLAERLTMGFFRNMDVGNVKAARKLAQRLTDQGQKLGLTSREIFVWELRYRLLGKILKDDKNSLPIFWDTMLGLGSYDMGNAWALWTAHRRLNGYPALPASLRTFDDARKLSVLRKSWLTGNDIRSSEFSRELKAGLGAVVLKNQELSDHLALHPDPPSGYTVQGWWVSGQRASRRGQADYYEKLGSRNDLKPGWQLDVFRRASEVHLLKNQWQSGLENLELSLEKAGAGSGSSGQRRRLRQWAEQALVLALAKGDTLSAQKIHTMTKTNSRANN